MRPLELFLDEIGAQMELRRGVDSGAEMLAQLRHGLPDQIVSVVADHLEVLPRILYSQHGASSGQNFVELINQEDSPEVRNFCLLKEFATNRLRKIEQDFEVPQ